MAFCQNCGQKLAENAKFCANCGTPVGAASGSSDGSQRVQKFVGEIKKCPSCGAVLQGMVAKCPECGMELNNTKVVNSLQEFTDKLLNAKDIEEKINIINVYPIPNSKEDIIEFLIFAKSQLLTDEARMQEETLKTTSMMTKQFGAMFGRRVSSSNSVLDLDNAWVSKIKQCRDKASVLFSGDAEIMAKIDELMPKKQSKNPFKNMFGRKV